MLGHDADALDATQDALVAAVRALPRFDGRSTFGTWLYRIATNTCLDELRRRRRRPVVGLDVGAAGTGPPEPARASGGGGPVERDPAEVAAQRIDVDAALRALPVEFRTVVVLRDVADLRYDEIAEILAVPIGTVRSRLARGRAALAEWAGNPTQPDVVQEVRPTPAGPASSGPTRPAPTDAPTPRQEEHSR